MRGRSPVAGRWSKYRGAARNLPGGPSGIVRPHAAMWPSAAEAVAHVDYRWREISLDTARELWHDVYRVDGLAGLYHAHTFPV